MGDEEKLRTWHSIAGMSVVLAFVGLSISVSTASAAPFVYQIDNGTVPTNGQFQNSLTGEAEDSWVGNTFTAKSGSSTLTSISWFSGIDLNNLPAGGNVTAALYSGTPATGLTFLESTSVPYAGMAENAWQTTTFSTPVTVAAGSQFTAALLIDNTPSTSFPFSEDSSGSSTNGTHGSYYDISNPVGATNVYNIASPNFPVLNGATYLANGVTNAGGANTNPGITMLRVNAIPEPSSIALAAVGLVAMCGYGVSRRRVA